MIASVSDARSIVADYKAISEGQVAKHKHGAGYPIRKFISLPVGNSTSEKPLPADD
jgi:hypothetical protein